MDKISLQKVGKSFEELTEKEMKQIQGADAIHPLYGSRTRSCYNWSGLCTHNGYNNSTRLTGCNNNWWF